MTKSTHAPDRFRQRVKELQNMDRNAIRAILDTDEAALLLPMRTAYELSDGEDNCVGPTPATPTTGGPSPS